MTAVFTSQESRGSGLSAIAKTCARWPRAAEHNSALTFVSPLLQCLLTLLCFSVVSEVAAADWAILAAGRRASSISHWVC